MFYLYMTGKLVFGINILNSGLQQNMFYINIPIKFLDIIKALGNLQDEIQK